MMLALRDGIARGINNTAGYLRGNLLDGTVLHRLALAGAVSCAAFRGTSWLIIFERSRHIIS
jgi:hypothetical protein